MQALLFHVTNKQPRQTAQLGSINDFNCNEGVAVNAYQALQSRQWSLYCLDHEQRQAIFVALPAGVNLTLVAHMGQVQYEQAQQVLALPYATFFRAAALLPAGQRPIFVYSPGHSGAATLHRAFNESGMGISLQAPIAPSQLGQLRQQDQQGHTLCKAEQQRLAQSMLRFLFRNHKPTQGQRQVLFMQGPGVQVMDVFHSAFPQAKHVFLYTNAPAYVAAALPSTANKAGCVRAQAMQWVAAMEAYSGHAKSGVPAIPVDYEALNANPERGLGQLFVHCELPLATLPMALHAWGGSHKLGNSLQAGLPACNEKQALSAEEEAEVLSIVNGHTTLGKATPKPWHFNDGPACAANV